MHLPKSIYALCLALLGAGCAPADFVGTYAMTITNDSNGCGFSPWSVGATTPGVNVVISQSGDQISANLGVISSAFLEVTLGASSFNGSASGHELDLTLIGRNTLSLGGCTYTVNASLHGTLNGDALSGVINYTSASTVGSCATVQGCVSQQSFSGAR